MAAAWQAPVVRRLPDVADARNSQGSGSDFIGVYGSVSLES